MDPTDLNDEVFIAETADRFAVRYAICCHLVGADPQPFALSKQSLQDLRTIKRIFANTVPLCEGFLQGFVDRGRLWHINETYQQEQELLQTQSETIASQLGLKVEDPACADQLYLALTAPGTLHSIIYSYLNRDDDVVRLDSPHRDLFRQKCRVAQGALRPAKDGRLAIDKLIIA